MGTVEIHLEGYSTMVNSSAYFIRRGPRGFSRQEILVCRCSAQGNESFTVPYGTVWSTRSKSFVASTEQLVENLVCL